MVKQVDKLKHPLYHQVCYQIKDIQLLFHLECTILGLIHTGNQCMLVINTKISDIRMR